MASEEQQEELEALRSIYDGRLVGMTGIHMAFHHTKLFDYVELSEDPVRIKIIGIVGDGVGTYG